MGARMRRRSIAERVVFDPMEPRLLLNADVLTFNLAHDSGPQPIDHHLIVDLVNATEQVNSQSVTVQRVQILDQTSGNAVLAFGDLSEISAISIVGGSGSTTLEVDAGSFKGVQAPHISFTGGSGLNTVVFDNAGSTKWTLRRRQPWRRPRRRRRSFVPRRAESDRRGRRLQLPLTVEQGGTLSGVFDAGSSGKNALVFDNGPHIGRRVIDRTRLRDERARRAGLQLYRCSERKYRGSDVLYGERRQSVVHPVAGHGASLKISSPTDSTFAATDISVSPDASGAFTLNLASGDSLKVTAINFDQISHGANLVIAGGSSIEFAGSFSSSTGLNATVSSTDSRTVTDGSIGGGIVSAGSETITAPAQNATISLDSAASIQASTISFYAGASATEMISTASSYNAVTSAKIFTSDTASISIAGSLDAAGAVSLISNVGVDDSISNSEALILQTVTVSASQCLDSQFPRRLFDHRRHTRRRGANQRQRDDRRSAYRHRRDPRLRARPCVEHRR